jgi:dihydroneopterin aldolase / 2-amino-4-hydroxy-6-hydroxymethyldihydropteridine diphosphokinase / dihydropteroate synthase
MSPKTLLRHLKEVELRVGRVPSFINGPRAIDLDIVFYDRLVLDTRFESPEDERYLTIPHPRLQEREFVLRPLVESVFILN